MIYVVGIGPGNQANMTAAAAQAIEDSNVIVGYKTYIDLILPLIGDREVIQNGMRREVDRCKAAIESSRQGNKVAVISSGDAGVYGMAGLIYELSEGADEVVVIPGVTASCAAAAVVGAPLMHDFCHISLSDLLTPYELIKKRVRCAAEADFAIAVYNPRSNGRPDYLAETLATVKEIQGDLICAAVHDAGRDDERYEIATLSTLDVGKVGMTSIVLIGNSMTKLIDGKMVTPRGYRL